MAFLCGLYGTPITAYYVHWYLHFVPDLQSLPNLQICSPYWNPHIKICAVYWGLLLSSDPFHSVRRKKTRCLCFVLPFTISLIICRRVLSCDVRGLHVDLGTATSIHWACGLAAASCLLFFLYNRITSTKQKRKKKKERHSQQFPGQAALFSHLGRSWGLVHGLLSALCQHVHTNINFATLSLGNTQPGNSEPVSPEWNAGSSSYGI